MKALVLGARGAVGRVIAAELRGAGHTVTPAGRSGLSSGVRVDLTARDGLAVLQDLADDHDVVINASGVENARIVTAVSGSMLVDISATGSYLDALRRGVPRGTGVVLGAGLVPGLSTVLLAALGGMPGDDLDLAVVLGGGETHGAAAVEWTANLAGRELYRPPEGGVVLNFRDDRRLPGAFGVRKHLRADFPDHLLIGATRGFSVRTYLATDSRIATTALGLVGRFPRLRRLVARAPHLGGERWSLTALNRRNGRVISARGTGQSSATGVITARMADLAGRLRPNGPMTGADLLTLDGARELPGIHIA